MVELLPDIHADSSKHTSIPPAAITSINITNDSNVQNENVDSIVIHLSLSTKKLIDVQNDDTFFATVLKLINEKKAPPESYFIDIEKLLHKIVWKMIKYFAC